MTIDLLHQMARTLSSGLASTATVSMHGDALTMPECAVTIEMRT